MQGLAPDEYNKLWVVWGIGAARVMLAVTNTRKAGNEMSRCPGNMCRISAFLSQNCLCYLIEQNSPLLEPPVPAHEVGPRGKPGSFSSPEV